MFGTQPEKEILMNRLDAFSSTNDSLPSSGLPTSPALSGGRFAQEASVRWDLIRRLRAEIAAGTYATQARWEGALSGLTRDLGRA